MDRNAKNAAAPTGPAEAVNPYLFDKVIDRSLNEEAAAQRRQALDGLKRRAATGDFDELLNKSNYRQWSSG